MRSFNIHKMVNRSLILVCSAMVSVSLFGATPTKELHPVLLGIFEQITREDADPKLEGKEVELDLTVKLATARFLTFSDAAIRVDGEETTYQVGKWIFTPEQITGLGAQPGDLCRVRFIIEEVRTGPPYSNMPHFTAKILSLELVQTAGDSIGQSDLKEKEREFEKRYFSAIDDSDEAMFKLVEFSDQAPEIFNEMLKEVLQEDRIRTITEVVFREPTEESMQEFTYEGVVYVPTLEIVREFVVSFEETSDEVQITGSIYSLGIKDGRFKIVGPRPKL